MTVQEIAARLCLAALLGGLVGIERQLKHHPVGMRTNVLVCIAAAMVMILSQLITQQSFQLYGQATDPRLGAQVITGIGFLGAGTIMHANSTIRGLTTAASLWSVACIGLAVGAGFYQLGIITCLLVLIVLFVMNYITKQFSRNLLTKQVTIISKPDTETVLKILNMIKSAGVDMEQVQTDLPYDDEQSAEIIFVTQSFKQNENILKNLKSVDGIINIKM